ncbi:hypothetical protein K2173_021002 [Erythroxylum novogranatense]|uniref:EF-hand domain-containing protein n=1 Tax=Erythroxylum novogranatense TaxID=1862640 RepID=A0AAV8TMI1_9ROSI|nr:hypothetical protein K2173_021002 [Erythroxylum novogranatense]
MVTTLLMLLLLFIAGLFSVYSYLPHKKIESATIPVESNTVATPQVVASRREISADKKAELRSVFDTFDQNGDGFVTKKELRESLKNIKIFMTEEEVEEVVAKVDSNGDGLIDFEEFCLLCELMGVQDSGRGGGGESSGDVRQEGDRSEGDLKEAFDVFDKDKDGLITVEELDLVLSSLGLKKGKRVEDCKAMIRKFDVDGDGMVNFDEFKMMMRGGDTLVSAF